MFCTLWYHQEYSPPAGEYYPESKIRLQIFSYLNLLYKFAQRGELRVWKHQFTGKYAQTGEGNGNQYYCLENSMDRRVWWATCSPWSCRVRHNLATKKNISKPHGSEGKESSRNAEALSSIPESGRSPGEENGTPLQYSCLENPMDRGAWWATGLQSIGSQRVGQDWAISLHFFQIAMMFASLCCLAIIWNWKGKLITRRLCMGVGGFQ